MITGHSKAFLILVLVLTTITTAHGIPNVYAQNSKPITYDSPVEGQISNEVFAETWILQASGKDRISVEMTRTEGSLIPNVEIRDINGQFVSGDNAYDDGQTANIRDATLSTPGEYRIIAGRYSGETGKTIGKYRLVVTVIGSGEDNPIVNEPAKPIAYDTPVSGTLTNARWREAWEFDAPANDVLSITASRTEGTLLPEIQLLDAANNRLTQGTVSRDGLTAVIPPFALKATGKYIVIVSRDGRRDGRTEGSYSLTVGLMGAGTDRKDLYEPVGPVEFDTPITGELIPEKWINVYSFETLSKDRLSIRVRRTVGSLVPLVGLFGANNQQISVAYPNQSRAEASLNVTLPGPGKYTIRVWRDDQERGVTLGRYELLVRQMGYGVENPIFNTISGELKVDAPVQGTISQAKWKELWTFTAQKGTTYTFTATRIEGTLFPTLMLIDEKGDRVTSGGTKPTFDNAEMRYTFREGGTFRVVVGRTGERDGQTTGTYEVSVRLGD